MKVLIVGSGGREHALAWRIGRSPELTSLWVAGGNAGTAQIAKNLPIKPEDVDGVLDAAKSKGVDLVVVGPEVPLSLGIVDKLDAAGIPAFGPTKAAAQIESSKSFALEVMRDVQVPCPDFHVFTDQADALSFLDKHTGPLVVKADGLAAGKGVTLCQTAQDSAAAVRECMTGGLFGDAGKTVVLEEMLAGPEVSVFAFCDGENISEPATACDYKRLKDGDRGPNTGGMGSFAPAGLWDASLAEQVNRTILRPVVQAMAERGAPYKGVLYAGVMLTADGPKVLEFNCRFGDPETQVVMPLLETDPLQVMMACHQGGLSQTPIKWSGQHHAGVVMVSGGYPGSYRTGFEISGLDDEEEDTLVFHGGTASGGTGRVVTDGGRVLTVVGRGDSLAQARTRAYDRLRQISFQDAYHRKDIAGDLGSLVIGARVGPPGSAAAR